MMLNLEEKSQVNKVAVCYTHFSRKLYFFVFWFSFITMKKDGQHDFKIFKIQVPPSWACDSIWIQIPNKQSKVTLKNYIK